MSYKRKLYPAEHIRDLKVLVERSAKLYGDSVAFEQIVSKTETETVSFNQLLERTNAIGTQLISMGLKGKHIAVVGENSIEWLEAYFSIVNGVGVAVPLDKELQYDTMAKQINISECSAVFCSYKLYKKIKQALPECPNVQYCIVMRAKDSFDYEAENCLAFNDVLENGKKLVSDGDTSFIKAEIDPDKMSEIIFTSGTTGANKGVILSHKNVCATVYSSMRLIRPGDTTLSVLPINHSYEKNTHLLGAIYLGARVCFNDDLKHVVNNLERFSPDFMIVVPMFLETMLRKIRVETEKSGLTENLRWGVKYSNFIRKFGIDLRKIFFKPIHASFGGNLRQIVCGGAPLSKEIVETFDSYGINVVEGYGITECSPLVAANCTRFKKIGSVGMVVPGTEVRIDNPDAEGYGEILVRGDNVMIGYYKDEESTKAVFTEDGWFRTGDIGRKDKKNFLYVSGRVKNLIILPNGKNVFPEEIEEKLISQIAYIKEVVVYADENNTGIYAACYLDDEYLTKEGVTDRYAYLMNDIAKFNAQSASFKRITNVVIYDTEFEKTTTKKIQRFKIERRTANV